MGERRYAILIASSLFPDEPKLENLRFPENDVDGLDELLSSEDYGNFTETFVLKNTPHHEIMLQINLLLRKVGRNDLVLLYYSGHGKLNPNGKLYLSATNTIIGALEATSISLESVKNYIEISSSNRIVIILDCCYSGAVGEVFGRGGADDQLQFMSKGRGTFIMTASTGIQAAVEKESDQYGIFTKHIIQGIKSGKADYDKDGLITVEDIYAYVHEHICNDGCVVRSR